MRGVRFFDEQPALRGVSLSQLGAREPFRWELNPVGLRGEPYVFRVAR
jgi:hypothetical protein